MNELRMKMHLRMKKSVGCTSSRLTVRLLDLNRPQLNRIEQVFTGHCNLQRSRKLQVVLSLICVQNVA